jgi:hypothetical protein
VDEAAPATSQDEEFASDCRTVDEARHSIEHKGAGPACCLDAALASFDRAVAAHAPCRQELALGDVGQEFTTLEFCSPGRNGISHDIGGHERPGMQDSPEFLGQDDEVNDGLIGDGPAVVSAGDEHRSPAQSRRLPPPHPVEDLRVLELGAQRRQRLPIS